MRACGPSDPSAELRVDLSLSKVERGRASESERGWGPRRE